MAPKELFTSRLLLEHPDGLYASEMVHLSNGRLPRGTIYMLLQRMVDAQVVKATVEPASAVMNLARSRYRLTAAGKSAYLAFLDDQSLAIAPFKP